MPRSFLAAGMVVLASFATAAFAEETPAEIANRFCALQMGGGQEAIRPMLTGSLEALIAEAEERNATIAAGAPNEKPPLGDGIPYQSFPDRAPKCDIGAVKEAANGAIVEISYSFPGKTGADWTDRLVLRPEDGKLLIDDILFQTFPTDTYAAGLRRFLTDSFDL